MVEFEMSMRPEEYQAFVVSTFHKPGAEDQRREFAELTCEELIEAVFQHTGAISLLLPSMMSGEVQVPPEKRDAILDEILDLGWYGFAAAELMGIRAGDACKTSLKRHAPDVRWENGQALEGWDPLQTLADLEAGVMACSWLIKFPNGRQETGLDPDDPRCFTSLHDNPFLALTYTTNRLVRLLNGGERGPSPSVMSDMERELDKEQVVGDFLNTIFYITRMKFEEHFDEAVLRTVVKITEREAWGKP